MLQRKKKPKKSYYTGNPHAQSPITSLGIESSEAKLLALPPYTSSAALILITVWPRCGVHTARQVSGNRFRCPSKQTNKVSKVTISNTDIIIYFNRNDRRIRFHYMLIKCYIYCCCCVSNACSFKCTYEMLGVVYECAGT